MSRQEARAGARAVAPMLIGVAPFGLVVGATSVTDHFGIGAAVGLSTIVFAGASQLAILQALASGGSAIVAAVAAWTINLRILLYSASLAPELTHVPTHRRLLASYFLTDQAYAVCITRWKVEHTDRAGRLSYYLGAAVTLWVVWQLSTIVGALIGSAVPPDVPVDFAIPLVFLPRPRSSRRPRGEPAASPPAGRARPRGTRHRQAHAAVTATPTKTGGSR